MSSSETALDRFLRYAAVSTQSDPMSDSAPSSSGQLDLARMLVSELHELGIANAELSEGGVVYASIPATPGCEKCMPAGFIAHMDTSPDAPGEGVRPQIVRYQGGDIVLSRAENIIFSAERFPEIRKYIGEDVIFTDGRTLLGADDKAGIAVIMSMAARLMADPGIPHVKICIAFTADEEIGRGTENFSIERFGAGYAYTIDGGEAGELESENFNAASVCVTFKGIGVHPGSAKGKMVNALRRAAEFISRLPSEMSPEQTAGREGYIHPTDIGGDVTQARLLLILRDHDAKRFDLQKEIVRLIARDMTEAMPQAPVTVKINDAYQNMKPLLRTRQIYRGGLFVQLSDPHRR